jgi:hypothetical protein
MCKFDPRESTLSILLLPDDVVHLVFLKLNFKDKINAGLVCKQWDHLLRAGTAAARHWVINYSVDRIITSKAFTGNEGSVGGDPNLDIGRYVILLGLPLATSTCFRPNLLRASMTSLWLDTTLQVRVPNIYMRDLCSG